MIRDVATLMSLVRRAPEQPQSERIIRTAEGGKGATVRLYKAIADASGGEIQVKAVKADGTVVGDAITLKVLP